MATYNARIEHLTQAIASIRNQTYPLWELCIADDASTDSQVVEEVTRLAALDNRICFTVRPQNGHIAAATNSALELATGDFIAFIDQDDLLDEQALYWLASTISATPDATLIYSDEDKIDETGHLYDPHFKPDFNYELLLTHNYIGHLTAVRTEIIRQVGGLKTEYNGAQDYDLILRVVEVAPPETIVHIPRVLYHWRATPGSTAIAVTEKGYAADAGFNALKSHLIRTGQLASAAYATEKPEQYRVRHTLSNQPLVTVIIPTRDRVDLISTCISSLTKRSTYKNLDIIVVDNGSTDADTLVYLEGLPSQNIRVVRNEEPFNFSRLNNLAAKDATGEFLCCLNNDVEIIQDDWLEEMISFAQLPGVGCVGARLWYPNGDIQHAGIILGMGGIAGHPHKGLSKGSTGYFNRAIHHQSLSAVTAACLVVRKSVFDHVGGFDEDLAVAFNDVDLCLRIRASGLRNIWTPYANLIHHESLSRGEDIKGENLLRFQQEIAKMEDRWGDQLRCDPAYNPNLSLSREDFALAWPPRLPVL
jgi:GT2 family glycosyltransferase